MEPKDLKELVLISKDDLATLTEGVMNKPVYMSTISTQVFFSVYAIPGSKSAEIFAFPKGLTEKVFIGAK